jgi:hypothetical protein
VKHTCAPRQAYEADHRAAVEAQDAKHWRAGRAMGALAAPVSKIEAERRRKQTASKARKESQ